ncbi:hypothetical protein NFI96_005529, partial [Prochilodus magdalenae]
MRRILIAHRCTIVTPKFTRQDSQRSSVLMMLDLTSKSVVLESDIIYAFPSPPPLYIRGGVYSNISTFVFANLSNYTTKRYRYHHSLPSSPYSSSGPEAQRLAASGALSSEFLNQGAGTVKILLLVCNAAGAGQQAVRFGPPFLMREDRSVSWDQLQQSILSKLYYLMINGAQPQVPCSQRSFKNSSGTKTIQLLKNDLNTRVLFKIRVVGGSVSCSYLCPQDGRPLYHPAVDRALKLCGSGGPPHVKLIVEWEHRIKDCLFGNIQEEVVKDSESVRTQQQQHVQQHSCTLDECFQLYTKEEQLAPDDAWKCPHCKQLQQGMVQMSLWTLPDILILHLKRFRQVGERRNKLSTLVRFPLTALDMAPHVVKRSNFTRLPTGWKHQTQRPETAQHAQDYLYDLYAVCNHHGGMHGGHYTDGFESRPFVRGTQGRSDRKKPTSIPKTTPTQPGELVEYLESGRRPRCTKEPIVSLVASPAQVKAQQLQEGDSLSSPSGSSSLSGMERGSCPGPDSPRVPEGQSRPVPDRGTANAKGRDDGPVARKSVKKSKQEQHGKTQDGQSHQSSTTGIQSGTNIGSSTPASKDSTLKRLWSQQAGATRTPHNQIQPEDSTGSKREEARSQDGAHSFLKASSLKKDNQSKEGSTKEAGPGKMLNNKNSTKLSLSNGTLNGVITEEKKPNGAHRSSNGQHNSKALIVVRDFSQYCINFFCSLSDAKENKLKLCLHFCGQGNIYLYSAFYNRSPSSCTKNLVSVRAP